MSSVRRSPRLRLKRQRLGLDETCPPNASSMRKRFRKTPNVTVSTTLTPKLVDEPVSTPVTDSASNAAKVTTVDVSVSTPVTDSSSNAAKVSTVDGPMSTPVAVIPSNMTAPQTPPRRPKASSVFMTPPLKQTATQPPPPPVKPSKKGQRTLAAVLLLPECDSGLPTFVPAETWDANQRQTFLDSLDSEIRRWERFSHPSSLSSSTSVVPVAAVDVKEETDVPSVQHAQSMLRSLMKAQKAVTAAPALELQSACNGSVLALLCVHHGEPKRYHQEPNLYASQILNLWNLHGPFLVLGTDRDTNDVTSLTPGQLTSLRTSSATTSAAVEISENHIIHVGPTPARTEDGHSIGCSRCKASAILPLVDDNRRHYCIDCHPSSASLRAQHDS